jgi:peptidoglycan-N-acetylglucosamine deacetylase
MYSSCVWHIRNHANSVYLTFDDGPHPTITPYILDLLKEFKAKATFFCIGDNVQKYPDLYARIISEGHSVGNHTYHHLNGFKVGAVEYLDNIAKADKVIASNLFRPPYGRIKIEQIRNIYKQNNNRKIIMWDVLSGDFDTALAPETCLEYVVNNTVPGSIIVFHDSDKAYDRLSYTLPKFLAYIKNIGWQMKRINY